MTSADRYDTSSLNEARFEPGSHGRVLKNRLGIKSKRKMDEAEANALKNATDKLIGVFDIDHRFTAADINAMHRIWLGDIYDWAGEYRQVNVSKGDFRFATALHIPHLMKEFENDILRKYTPCNFKSSMRLVQALAIVHAELVLIHPFREGNGRIARLLSILMALQGGVPPLDFTGIAGKKADYIASVQAGMERDYRPMEKIFTSVIRRTLKAHARQ